MGDNNTGGRWTTDEMNLHINCLELKAAFFSLQAFCSEMSNKHIKIEMDNTTAVAYVNHKGGSRTEVCNDIEKMMWEWCFERNIWLTATHISGVSNVYADKKSRIFNDQTEWMLNRSVFLRITELLGTPDIDLFASRLNYQLKPFVSWQADPEALTVDAFSISWKPYNLCYMFPPFSLISHTLQKLGQEEAEGVIVVPAWTTQCWFPKLLQMLTSPPVYIPASKTLLEMPFQTGAHVLWRKLNLMICRISGKTYKPKEFLRRLPTSSWTLGEQAQKNNIECTWKNGLCFVVQGRQLHCTRL